MGLGQQLQSPLASKIPPESAPQRIERAIFPPPMTANLVDMEGTLPPWQAQRQPQSSHFLLKNL